MVFCRAFAASYNESPTMFLRPQFFTKLFQTNFEIVLHFTGIKKFIKYMLLTFNKYNVFSHNVLLDIIKVFSPTDAQLNCLKSNFKIYIKIDINPLNAELNPICHLLALLGAHHIFHVSGLRVETALTCFGVITVIRERNI